MKVIKVNNEKIAIPEVNECIGNTTFTIYTHTSKYPISIEYTSNIDVKANTSVYSALCLIQLTNPVSKYEELYFSDKHNDNTVSISGREIVNSDSKLPLNVIEIKAKSTTNTNITTAMYNLAIDVLINVITIDNATAKKDVNISNIPTNMKHLNTVLGTMCNELTLRNIYPICNRITTRPGCKYIDSYDILCKYKDTTFRITYNPSECIMRIILNDNINYIAYNVKSYKDYSNVIDKSISWII